MAPFKPAKPCAHPGCPGLTRARFCVSHAREHEKERGSTTERGYSAGWQKLRARILATELLCRLCKAEGEVTAAVKVGRLCSRRCSPGWRPPAHRYVASSVQAARFLAQLGAK